MYWEITPHKLHDYDSCVMLAETADDHRGALLYAQDVLEQLWDDADVGDLVTVTMKLCEGAIPEGTEDAP